METLRRKHGVCWAGRGTRHLLRTYGTNLRRKASTVHDLLCELEPGTVPGICGVDDSGRVRATELDDNSRQIDGIGGAPTLIVDYVESGTIRGQLQDRVRK